MSSVLDHLLEPHRRPHGARVLLHHRDAAELPTGRVPRVCQRHPTLDVLLGLAVDVVADVLVEVFEAPPSLHAGLTMRAMARVSRSHLLVSTTSCLRPLAVKR